MNARPVLAASAVVLAVLAVWIVTRRSRSRPAHLPTTPVDAATATLSAAATRPNGPLEVVDGESERHVAREPGSLPARESERPTPAFGVLVGHLYDSRYRTLARHKLSIRDRRADSDDKYFFVITELDGAFRFKRPIPAGDWWLSYEGDAKIGTTVARRIRDEPIHIRPNETTSEEIVLVDDQAIVGQIAFDETAHMSIVVLLASEFAPDLPLLELWIGNYPEQRTNGEFQIPAIATGDYRLTYCLDTVDPEQRICVSETITVLDEDLRLPPKPISWTTFGLAGVEIQPFEQSK